MHRTMNIPVSLNICVEMRAGNPSREQLQTLLQSTMDAYCTGVEFGASQGFSAMIKDVKMGDNQPDDFTDAKQRTGKAAKPAPAADLRPFAIGDWVGWESQSQGVKKGKNGEVCAVVPAGELPSKADYPQLHRKSIGRTRDHESYVVKVGTKYYWPFVKLLKAA